MLEYGGGCPASPAAIAIKKKKKNLQALEIWSLYQALCTEMSGFFTYKQL